MTKQLSLLSSVKTSGRFLQIFVAFSEKLKFLHNCHLIFLFRVSSSSNSSRSSSRSPVRLISRSNSSSSSSDNENEPASTENDKKKAPQSGFKNPLFMLNQKNKEGKSDEDVKQVLVEKLFSLLSNEENNKEKQENVEKTAAAEPMDVDNVEKVEKEKPLPLLYASNKVILYNVML